MAKRKTKKKPARPRKSRPAKTAKLPKDAVTLFVQLRPRDGQEMLLEAELRALVGPTRKEDGCLTYDLHRSAEAPTAYLLHEVWASREAHSRHINTPALPPLERPKGFPPRLARRQLLEASPLIP